MNTFSLTGSYGYIRLFREYVETTFWIGQVTGITTVAGFHTLTVTHQASNGTFTTDDLVVGTWTPLSEGIIGTEAGVIASGPWIPGVTAYVPAVSATGQYANLSYTNSTGGSKDFKVDVSFNCGDEIPTAATTNGSKACIKCGLFINGVLQYEIHNFLSLGGDPTPSIGVRQGQAFTIGVTVADTQIMDVRFATSDIAVAPEDGRVNSATFYYREA